MIFNADVSGAIGSSVQSGNSELLARFPGESPEERLATEWIKDTYSRLIAAGFGAILRRTTPPHLIALEDSTATSVPVARLIGTRLRPTGGYGRYVTAITARD